MKKLVKHVRDLLDRKRSEQLAYEAVFNTEDGKRVLTHMLKNGFVFTSTVGKTHDETMMNEGTRRFVLSVFRKVHRGMDDYNRELQKVMQESD